MLLSHQFCILGHPRSCVLTLLWVDMQIGLQRDQVLVAVVSSLGNNCNVLGLQILCSKTDFVFPVFKKMKHLLNGYSDKKQLKYIGVTLR